MRRAATSIACLCALCLGACGNTLSNTPIGHNLLEGMIVTQFPVYWLGESFHGLAISEVTHDTSGGFSIQYGDCVQGGQTVCVTALRVVTSPDNSFLPGSSAPGRTVRLRSVSAKLAQGGRTIILAAGPVIVGVYANSAALAGAAARTLATINVIGPSALPLPAPTPNTGYDERPLDGQAAAPIAALPAPRAVRRARRARHRGARRPSSA